MDISSLLVTSFFRGGFRKPAPWVFISSATCGFLNFARFLQSPPCKFTEGLSVSPAGSAQTWWTRSCKTLLVWIPQNLPFQFLEMRPTEQEMELTRSSHWKYFCSVLIPVGALIPPTGTVALKTLGRDLQSKEISHSIPVERRTTNDVGETALTLVIFFLHLF